MNYVSAEGLSKAYGIKSLFENISFHINEGDKIAIVAKNGSGKSTLLKILMVKEIADSGEITINKDIQIVLFDQEIHFDPNLSVDEFMMTLDSALISYTVRRIKDNTQVEFVNYYKDIRKEFR